MSVFADTSAVVKLYADETGSEAIRALGAMFVSQLCRVEAPAALWRKNRMGELAAEEARILVQVFESDLFDRDGVLVPLRLTADILDDAAGLTAAYGLRAYDAVQLASARAVRAIDPECRTLAAFDVELREAAARDGFSLLPESIRAPAPAPDEDGHSL